MWYVCDVCLLFYYCIYWTSSLLIKIFFNSKVKHMLDQDRYKAKKKHEGNIHAYLEQGTVQ